MKGHIIQMKIYKIAQESSNDEGIERANIELQSIVQELENQYRGLELWVYETSSAINLADFKVPLELRQQGIGGKVVEKIKEFAQKRQKPITLAPESERGYKKKLENFYREHGFVHNRGRNKDYAISDPFSPTMYWRPQ